MQNCTKSMLQFSSMATVGLLLRATAKDLSTQSWLCSLPSGLLLWPSGHLPHNHPTISGIFRLPVTSASSCSDPTDVNRLLPKSLVQKFHSP